MTAEKRAFRFGLKYQFVLVTYIPLRYSDKFVFVHIKPVEVAVEIVGSVNLTLSERFLHLRLRTLMASKYHLSILSESLTLRFDWLST